MKKSACLVAFCGLLAAAAIPVAAVQPVDDFLASIASDTPQAFSERVGTYDPDQLRQQRAHLHRMLTSERVAEAAQSPIAIEVTRGEIRQLLEERRGVANRKMLAGVAKPVGARVDLAAVSAGDGVRRLAFGAVRTAGERTVWTGTAASPGAYGVRVHFTDVNLPRGAALYVYNADGAAFGPYTGRGPNGTGEFWSNMVRGDVASIQLRGPAGSGGSFNVAGIGHVDRELLGINPQAGTLCSFNAECVESAACTTSPAVADAQDAVAHIQFVSGGFIFICSGGLLNDTDTSSTIPYFLTANHCISREREADSMEAFFFFEATVCGGGCFNPDGVLPSTLGADILSASSTSDYTLMRLSQPAPAGAVLMGWNATPVANSNGTPLFRISHPQGAPQGYSEHVVDTARPTCSTWPRGNWIYSSDILGATEGGSSGSPVVNGAGQVVGQLSGGCGFNVNDVCDTASNATVDGAFAAYFANVDDILDPSTGGGDPGGECLPAGSSCSDNADCCSGSCKGGRNKTCR